MATVADVSKKQGSISSFEGKQNVGPVGETAAKSSEISHSILSSTTRKRLPPPLPAKYVSSLPRMSEEIEGPVMDDSHETISSSSAAEGSVGASKKPSWREVPLPMPKEGVISAPSMRRAATMSEGIVPSLPTEGQLSTGQDVLLIRNQGSVIQTPSGEFYVARSMLPPAPPPPPPINVPREVILRTRDQNIKHSRTHSSVGEGSENRLESLAARAGQESIRFHHEYGTGRRKLTICHCTLV